MARLRHAHPPPPLGERAFNAGSSGIALRKLFSLLAGSSRHERFILGPRLQCERPRPTPGLRARTPGAIWAWQAVGGIEIDVDHPALARRVGLAPAEAVLAAPPGGLIPLPV